MTRTLGVLLVVWGLLALAPGSTVAARAAAPPVHTLSASGTEVGMYPAFDPGIERYGLTTTGATNGTITVHATTDDPTGRVLVDGRPAPAGTATVAGLTEGDEISVIFQDVGGTSVHSLVYLPAQFPRMTETVPAQPGTSPGDVLVNLSKYAADGSPNFEAVLDRHGVPRHVQSFPSSVRSGDLTPGGPPGHFTVLRSPTTTPGRTGNQLVELNEKFEEVHRYETTGLVDTDGHDSLLRPDGSRILLGYEPNARTGKDDAVIQEVDATGNVVYTWNSAEHMDPAAETTTDPGIADYAHLNSMVVMADGDILASFRHLSTVLKIAWHAHDGFARGDIVWRLGGRHSDFTFVNDPYPSGPCAQHSATELSNGHILVYDNGSVTLGADPSHCVDPNDPEGPTVARQQSRVTEYALDTQAGTATLVWSFQVDGWFSYFAGSARRLANGNTLIGWAAERRALATEVDPAKHVLWELKNDDSYLSYRVLPAVVPDAVDPSVDVTVPAAAATYTVGQQVNVDATCTDRGGSSLRVCDAPSRVDTSTAGQHTLRVTATDGAGNRTTRTVGYDVVAGPVYRPDSLIRGTGTAWIGDNIYASPAKQTLEQTFPRDGVVRTVVVRLQNDGNRTERLRARGTPGSSTFGVEYLLGTARVTPAMVGTGLLTPPLAPGGSVDVTVRVRRLSPAGPTSSRAFQVYARSATITTIMDHVTLSARSTG